MQVDSKGREIKHGDLLKIPHFKCRSGRNVFMYKLVVLVDDNCKISPQGKWLYCVDVTDIARSGIEKAFKCPLTVIDACEIIDDASDGIERAFWERKKHRVAGRVVTSTIADSSRQFEAQNANEMQYFLGIH